MAMPSLTNAASQLSLEERIGQLIFVRIGSNLPPVRRVEEDAERVARLLESCPVGGLLLFNGGPATKSTIARLQHKSNIPLLIAADIERGVGQQVSGHTLFPHAMAFEKLGRNAAAAVEKFAEATAREAHDIGIQISFAPVADVNTNPRNPIIATRAFSENIERAAELAAAYVAAAEAAGLRTTAKHFPGHGDTHQDSHDSLPVVERSADDLAACELVPFRAAIDAGCSLVMTAHVAYPAIDPTGLPATLSRTILEGVLRRRLGFRGVTCSDSLLMAGVRDRFPSEEEMALAALSAGVDLLLDLHQPARVIEYLRNCIEHGTLSRQRIDEAFERVWALKQRVFEVPTVGADTGGAASTQEHANLAAEVARGAIEAFGSSPALPLDPTLPVVAILLKPFETAVEPPEQPLAAALRARFRELRYVQLGPRADNASIEAAYRLARGAEQLLVALIVRPAAWHAFGLLPQQGELVRRLTQEREAVVVSLGVPYILHDYPDAAVRVCTFSDVPASQEALVEFLLARNP
jgi:beta-glucosidase-like glycosyl hydrolase